MKTIKTLILVIFLIGIIGCESNPINPVETETDKCFKGYAKISVVQEYGYCDTLCYGLGYFYYSIHAHRSYKYLCFVGASSFKSNKGYRINADFDTRLQERAEVVFQKASDILNRMVCIKRLLWKPTRIF